MLIELQHCICHRQLQGRRLPCLHMPPRRVRHGTHAGLPAGMQGASASTLPAGALWGRQSPSGASRAWQHACPPLRPWRLMCAPSRALAARQGRLALPGRRPGQGPGCVGLDAVHQVHPGQPVACARRALGHVASLAVPHTCRTASQMKGMTEIHLAHDRGEQFPPLPPGSKGLVGALPSEKRPKGQAGRCAWPHTQDGPGMAAALCRSQPAAHSCSRALARRSRVHHDESRAAQQACCLDRLHLAWGPPEVFFL